MGGRKLNPQVERSRFPPLLHSSHATLDCISSSSSSPGINPESGLIYTHHMAPHCNPMDMSQWRPGRHFFFKWHKHPLIFRVNGLHCSVHSYISPVEVACGKEVCLWEYPQWPVGWRWSLRWQHRGGTSQQHGLRKLVILKLDVGNG